MHDAISKRIEAGPPVVQDHTDIQQQQCPACFQPLAVATAVSFDCGHAICLMCGTRALRVLRSDFASAPPLARDDGGAGRGGAAGAHRPSPVLRWACGCAVDRACAGVLDWAAAGAAVERLRDGSGAGSEQAAVDGTDGSGGTGHGDTEDSGIR